MLCVGSSRASAAFWKRGLYLATLEYLVKDDVVMGRTSSGLDGSVCLQEEIPVSRFCDATVDNCAKCVHPKSESPHLDR